MRKFEQIYESRMHLMEATLGNVGITPENAGNQPQTTVPANQSGTNATSTLSGSNIAVKRTPDGQYYTDANGNVYRELKSGEQAQDIVTGVVSGESQPMSLVLHSASVKQQGIDNQANANTVATAQTMPQTANVPPVVNQNVKPNNQTVQ